MQYHYKFRQPGFPPWATRKPVAKPNYNKMSRVLPTSFLLPTLSNVWGGDFSQKPLKDYIINAVMPARIFVHQSNPDSVDNYPGDIHIFLDRNNFIIYVGVVGY